MSTSRLLLVGRCLHFRIPGETGDKQPGDPLDEGLGPRGRVLTGRADEENPFVHLESPLWQHLDKPARCKITDHRPVAETNDTDPLARRFEEGAYVV